MTTLEECRVHEEKTPLAEIDRFGTLQILKKVKVIYFFKYNAFSSDAKRTPFSEDPFINFEKK